MGGYKFTPAKLKKDWKYVHEYKQECDTVISKFPPNWYSYKIWWEENSHKFYDKTYKPTEEEVDMLKEWGEDLSDFNFKK